MSPKPDRHRISAGTLVLHEGRLLMVRHRRLGAYDFWVCPGGGVQGTESLEAAAARETREETGLEVRVGTLAYVEEFHDPDTRYVKFWFLAELLPQPLAEGPGGRFDISHPDTVGEHIVEAAWRTPDQVREGMVFPDFIQHRFWADSARGGPYPQRLPLRAMQVW